MQADAIDFRFVLLVRHPLEVVKSLLGRPHNPISKDSCLQLWIESVLSAERITRGMQRIVVIADDLFQSPSTIQAELQRFLGSDALINGFDRISTFIDPDLRHHRIGDNKPSQPGWGVNKCDILEGLAIKIYDEIQASCEALDKERLDNLHSLWLSIG